MARARRFFISYRRSDSADYAERLDERLARVFGEENVFLDREKIDLGDDFARVIDERVSSCDVLFALVGPNWVTSTDEHGRRRLDSPRDYVRHEIVSALKQSKRVIPVLVRGARMPDMADLPEDLKRFSALNAEQIRESDSGVDIRILILKLTGVWSQVDLLYLLKRFRRVVVPLASAAVLAMFFAAWVQLADYFNLDTRAESYTMWFGDMIYPPRADDRVAVVAIGPAAVERFKKPFDRTWRHEHARLITLLSQVGATAVAFDLFIDEPSAFDEELATAVRAARDRGTTVIFGVQHDLPPDSPLRDVVETALLCMGKKLGYASVAPLVVNQGSRFFPSLALATVLRGGKVHEIDIDLQRIVAQDTAGTLRKINFSRYEELPPGRACLDLPSVDATTPLRVTDLIVRFTPREELLRQSRGYEVVFELGEEELSKAYKGKIVLVGREDRTDKLNVFGDGKNAPRHGFQVHADTLNTLWQNVSIRPLDMWHQFWIMVFMGGLGQLAIWCNLSATRTRRAYLVATVLTYLALTLWAYVAHEVLLNTIYHLGAFFLSYWIGQKLARRIGVWDTRQR
jgi:CHASE2 domain-containing sensor protein